jgi:PAS domain S-box-containing protein
MVIELSTVLGLLIISGMVTTGLCVYAWSHRAMPGATAFALLALDATLWTLANALEMSGTSLPRKLFWANTQYLCYTTIPLLWLILALEFSGLEHWLSPRRVFLLLIIPAITNLLVWVDNRFELVRQNFQLDLAGPFPVIDKTYGPWWFIHTAFSYLVIAVAFLIIARAVLRAPSRIYRMQAVVLLVGLSIPLLWNILYITGLSPVKRHDLAPVVLSLSGLLVTWGLFRFRLFDILPVAQDAILKSINDGAVVFNAGGQVVAINPAARRLLDWPAASVIGRPGTELFNAWPELVELILDGQPAQLDFAIQQAETVRHYDLSLAPLGDRFNQPLGQLLILHDITERKKAKKSCARSHRPTL